MRQARGTKGESQNTAKEDIHRFGLRFQFHVPISEAPTNEVLRRMRNPWYQLVLLHIKPCLSVLPGKWESTTVAMFVTSSYGHILPKELASSRLATSYKNTCI